MYTSKKYLNTESILNYFDFRLEETFATVQMLLSLPIMKLSSGSRRRIFVTGLLPMTSGSMKEIKNLAFKKYILVAVVNP